MIYHRILLSQLSSCQNTILHSASPLTSLTQLHLNLFQTFTFGLDESHFEVNCSKESTNGETVEKHRNM